MKNVKVITRHSVANYGSLLQTYATQRTLEKLGYQTEIINYIPKEEQSWYLAFVRFKVREFSSQNGIKQLLFFLSQIVNYSFSYFMFKKFRSKLVKETALYSSLDELKSNPPPADIYLTGSDQVWGKIANQPYDKAFFLDFVPPGKKCVAYSASFGTETTHIPASDLKQLVQKYSSLNVRELSAVRILKELGFENCNHVLDPTLLLTREDWKSMAAKKIRHQKYVLVYQLHQNRDFEAYAEAFGKMKGLRVLRLSCSMNSILQKGNLVYMTSPATFLRYFMDAEYVLTDSFHATVFSIIFNKQFICISPGSTSTRMLSILKVFELEDRMLDNFQNFHWQEKTIDFTPVNAKLKSMQDDSLQHLAQSLVH